MPAFPGSDWITPVFAIIIFFYGGMPFLQMAVPELRNRQPGMMTLISLAITVAFVYSLAALFLPAESGFFWEMVTLIDIMLLGHWIEMRSVRQASGALNELAKLMPDTAERIGARWRGRSRCRVSQPAPGRSGAGPPRRQRPGGWRGREGESDVNEAMITGESKPVGKEPGDAGHRRDDQRRRQPARAGDRHRRRDRPGRHHAPGRAGPAEQVQHADPGRQSRRLAVLRRPGRGAITAVAWMIAVGFDVAVLARVATVLVIACPHALGLAIPLVVAITTSMGANNGILVRDRLALEKAREIDIVIFDKTGTLTEGEFGVVGMATAGGWSEEEALALAAAVEGDSEHTIARGIRRSAEERG